MSLKCASQYALVHHKQIVFNIKHLSKDKYVLCEIKMFFEYAARKPRLPLSYSTKHRFGQRSHKGYGREFAANVF